jgi:DnaK suppressor protein
MASAASDEIDILEKAKRLIADDYVPSEDEEYMNERQQAYFRMLLIEWKRSIHSAAGQTLQSLADGPIREADLTDRASSETDWGIELRTRDRQRKLVSKIDQALARIEEANAFTIPAVLQRIKRKTDPWAGYQKTSQKISREALRFFT